MVIDRLPVTPQPAPPRGWLGRILSVPIHLYHWHLGRLVGHRFLLLSHTGRRTGTPRETVLEVIRYDPDRRESVVMAGWGRRTGWFHNVEAGLAREVATGGDRFVPVHRVLDVDEAGRAFAEYEHRNRFAGPLVRAVISRLVGWRYDGSDAARRRLVGQLPLLAFRPPEPVDDPPAQEPIGDPPAQEPIGDPPTQARTPREALLRRGSATNASWIGARMTAIVGM